MPRTKDAPPGGGLPTTEPDAARRPSEEKPDPVSDSIADIAAADRVAQALASAVAWCAARLAALGVGPADRESGETRRRAYARGGGRWWSGDGPVAGPDAMPPHAVDARLVVWSWWASAPSGTGAGLPWHAPDTAGPAAGGPPAAPDGLPDFPPVSGAAVLPLTGPVLRFGLPALLLALSAWLYIRAGWPAVAHVGGFDHNAWEAAALLTGHVHTPPPPPGGTLDMMYYHGLWSSFFPPLPAFLLMPLVWYFHGPLRTPVHLFCAVLGALSPLFVYQMGERAGLRPAVRLWIAVLFAFGTVFWYAVDTGTPWYYVQVATVFFYLLALREGFGKNRPLLVGALFGAALLCRNPVALGFPFLFWRERFLTDGRLDLRRLDYRRLAGFCIPVAAAVAVQLWWNWARTGDPLDTGYAHIMMNPYFRASFSQGMFSIKHIPYQIYSMFFMAPAFHGQTDFNGVWPYLTLSSTGQSLLLTTPAWLYALEGDVRRRRVWLGLCAVLLTMIPQLLYYANGTGQFGNRFSLDYTPLLLALLIFGIGRRFRWQHAALILVSVFLCGYGAVYMGHVHPIPPSWLAHLAAVVPKPAASCLKLPWMTQCP